MRRLPAGKADAASRHRALSVQMDRRGAVTGLGGLALSVGAAATASSAWAWAGLAPDAPPSHFDPRLRALDLAALAPSSFNLQPWSIRMTGEHDIVVSAAPDRKAPICDGRDRQTMISIGAFLEILQMAAAAEGQATSTAYFPDGNGDGLLDDRIVAIVTLRPDPGVAGDRLLEQVTLRRSNKTPFTDRPVSANDLARIGVAADPTIVGLVADPDRVGQVRTIAHRAAMGEFGLPRMLAEAAGFTRLGGKEIASAPWGIALTGPGVEDGSLTRGVLADPASAAAGAARARYATLIDTAAAYVFVATEGDTRADQLTAGRAWVRINLMATELGIALQPHSHALHDYPERQADFAEIHRVLVAGDGRRVQMLGRLGYAGSVPATPRETPSAILARSNTARRGA
jgi:hypothetical protein